MLDTKSLTFKQLEILKLSKGKHVVLAPPGSGKTQLLSQRVTDALSRDVEPESMLCITFTNRAAKNMNDRVGDLGRRAPFIGTLHKFGYRFLLANQVIPATTILLDEEDAHQLLLDAVSAVKEDLRQNFLQIELMAAANYIREFNKARFGLREKISETEYVLNLEKVALKYNEIKGSTCAIDFDDILYFTLHTLCFKNPFKLCHYEWIQVDEVQDLSDLQWQILTKIAAEDAHVVYFGDYDQSIYSFMGASQSALATCTQGAVEHILEDNFRSPEYLINFFNAYALANMPARKVKEIKLNEKNTNTGGKVRVHHASGEFKHEAADIALKIVPKLADHLKNTAILTRTNNDADTISQALARQNIVHKRVSGFDLFRRRVIKDVMAFLKALGNPHDRLAWTRLLSTFGGIGTLKASRELTNYAFSIGMNPADWLETPDVSDSADLFVKCFQTERFVIFDTETTGLNLEDDIIQIAAIEIINGNPGAVFEAYIRTDKDLSESSKVHHITEQVLAGKGEAAHEVFSRFLNFVGDSPLSGHNIKGFDMPMLTANLARHNISWSQPQKVFDTLTLTKQLKGWLRSYKLASLIEEFKLEGKNTHNALDDVLATASLAKYLATEASVTAAKRNEAHKLYQRFINQFAIKLGALWIGAQKDSNAPCNLGDVVERFFDYAKLAIAYPIDADEQDHINTLVSYLREHTDTKTLTHHLGHLLRDLSTFSEADLITDDVKVVVSTIHKAKGLEFEGVVLASCVKDVYPHYYSKSPEAVREDARLFYVGLTRAKKEIVLTTHDTVVNRGGTFPRFESPFLRFLPRVPNIDQFSFG